MTYIAANFQDGGHLSELVDDDMALVVVARIEAMGGDVYLCEKRDGPAATSAAGLEDGFLNKES